MSSEHAIRVHALSKAFCIYERPQDRLKQAIYPRLYRLASPLLKLGGARKFQPPSFGRQFWALSDVSFDVAKGETVGIIGRNGSGKSTLLQLVCGTLTPTGGSVAVDGRVAALLELGAGFSPEFTGRENVYMNATLLGLSQEEIEARYEAIVEFSELGDFIDQPVKTYSSGMYVRLAFSVAISVEPDILVVDEALAVGDMLFQAKCMIRLKQLMENGLTVLFVSHDMASVKALCRKCLWLEQGRAVMFGPVRTVVEGYVSKMHMQTTVALDRAMEQVEDRARIDPVAATKPPASISHLPTDAIRVSLTDAMTLPELARRYGDGRATLLDVKLLNADRQPIDQIELRAAFHIQASLRVNADLPTLAFGYSIRDLRGQMLVGTITSGEDIRVPPLKAGSFFVFEIACTNQLTQGIYTVTVSIELPFLLNRQHALLEVIEHVAVFQSVFPADPARWFPTMVLVPAQFTCQILTECSADTPVQAAV